MADTSNPWSADGWNVTAQMAYLRANGQARADARARDAGTTVGGKRPVRAGAVQSGDGGGTTKYIILKKFYQLPTAPSPFFIVASINHGVGVDMAAFVTRELILPPAAPSIGFNSSAVVTLEKDLAVSPAAMGFNVAAVVDRFFQPTVSNAVGVSMTAAIQRSRELTAAPGLGITEAVVLTTFFGGLSPAPMGLAISQSTTLLLEFDAAASPALGVTQSTTLTRELDLVANPALGFSVAGALTVTLEQDLAASAALGFNTAASLTRGFEPTVSPALGIAQTTTLTREFDGAAAPALGIAQAVTITLTNNFTASPALGVSQATTLTREFDALMSAALGVTQATTVTTAAASPADLFGANLVRWWTADAGVGLSGSNVNTWTDQTAAADVLSTAGAFPPTLNATGINGQKSITFINSSSCALEGAAGAFPVLGGANGFTIFIVSKQHGQGNTSDTARYLSVTGTGQTTDWNNSKSIIIGIQFSSGRPDANAVALWANGVPLSSTVPQAYVGPFVTDTIHRFGYMFDGVNTITSYDNGPNAVQTNTGQTIDLSTVGRMVIGGQVTTINTSEAVPADIAQIIIVNRKATLSERQALDNYLSAKYSPGRTNPAFVNNGTPTNVTVSASSQTPALPASRVTGNLLLAFASVGFSGEVFTTSTTGWTRIYQANATNRSCAVFARFVDGTEAAPVINLGTAASNGAYVVAQYSNVKSVLAWGATGGADGAGFPRTAPAVTTTDDNSTLVLAGWPAGAAVSSFGTPTGYTQDVNDNGSNSASGLTTYHQNMGASGSVSSSWSSGGSGGTAWIDAIIELIAAG